MHTLIQHDVAVPYTKNDGMTLSINGLRKLINLKFINKNLEEARDLWTLSFFLTGLDIREILMAKQEEVMPGIFLAHKNKDDTIPLPLHDHAHNIFEKNKGKRYALKFIETGGIPGRIEGQKKATRMRFDLNRRMEVISKYMEIGNILPFENIRLMWMLLAKEGKMDGRSINIMSDFTSNAHNRKLASGNLERISKANNSFIAHIFGKETEAAPTGEIYPKKMGDGSTLLYERK